MMLCHGMSTLSGSVLKAVGSKPVRLYITDVCLFKTEPHALDLMTFEGLNAQGQALQCI